MKLGTANPSGGCHRDAFVGTVSRHAGGEVIGQQNHAVLSAKLNQSAQVLPARDRAAGGPMTDGGSGLKTEAGLDLLAGYPGALQSANCIGGLHGYAR